MKAEYKIKYLTWAVIALGLLTISMLSAFFYHVKAEKSREEIQLEFYSVQMTGRDFRDVLNFSPSQMAIFRDLNNNFRQDARDINIMLDNARTNMFIELKKPEPDMEKCKELSDEIGQLHRKLKEITCLFFLDTKEVCTPLQEEKLEELFAPIFSSTTGFGYGRGQGSGQGRFGRRWGSQ